MDEKEIKKPAFSNKIFHIMIIQLIVVLIFVISIFVMKIFFKSTFKNVREFYQQNFTAETDINEVLKASDGDVDEV